MTRAAIRKTSKESESAGILRPYQGTWVDDRSDVKVCVKSRRIGITWASAYEAVEIAALDAQLGGSNVWYMTYGAEDAKEFISDVESWARAFGQAITSDEEFIDDRTAEEAFLAKGHASVKITSIRFRSGFRITVLPAIPRKLRGKGGFFILDEADSFPDLDEALIAAQAFLMQGGRVAVISTMGAVDGKFAKLISDIKSGNGPRAAYSLHMITFMDAMADDYFEHVAAPLMRVKPTKKNREEYIKANLAREGADTELMCQPRLPHGYASIFNPQDWCQVADKPPKGKRVRLSIRAWDRAATKPTKRNQDPDWTRGVLMQWTIDGGIWIVDGIGLRDNPGEVNDTIKAAAENDPEGTIIGLWQDPGAAGVYEAEDMRRQLAGHHVHVERAREAKQTYWGPVARKMKPVEGAKHGPIKIVAGDWNDDFMTELSRCPNGLHDDWADALALAYLIGGDAPADFKISIPMRRRAAML